MRGLVSPGRVRRSQHALAVAFLLAEGGNAWGIYRLSLTEDSWVFFAAIGGQLSVMGDVTGSRAIIEQSAANFLRFNDADSPRLRCAATADDNLHAGTLTDRLSRAQVKRCRLNKRVTALSVIIPAAAVTLAVACGVYWFDAASEKAEQAAAMAAFRARMALTKEKPAEPARAPHPWASLPPVSVLLSNCWLTREPVFASVAGWRFTDGECVPGGLRLRFVATPGATVEDFSRRARELLGHSAVFNLQEGGKNGDVFIPFNHTPPTGFTDEALPGTDAQLMRFISHLQRRNLDVRFTEVKPPPVAPGEEKLLLYRTGGNLTFLSAHVCSPSDCCRILMPRDFASAAFRSP